MPDKHVMTVSCYGGRAASRRRPQASRRRKTPWSAIAPPPKRQKQNTPLLRPPAPPSGTPDEADGENETVPPELADINIEALDYDADYTQFLKEGVPEALKRRALRRLWRTNPDPRQYRRPERLRRRLHRRCNGRGCLEYGLQSRSRLLRRRGRNRDRRRPR